MHRQIILLAATLLAAPAMLHAGPPAAPAQPKPRVVQSFSAGWKFVQADAPGAEKAGFDDSARADATVPHDWAVAGPFKEDAPSKGAGAFAPTGVRWYRKSFVVPDADTTPKAARRTFVVFAV